MRFAALWLFLAGLATRFLVIAIAHVDGVYGQDSFAYLGCAREILAIRWGAVPCASFFWPLGYPALASVFMYFVPDAVRGAQLASVVVGAAIAPLVYWTVLELRSSATDASGDRRIAVAAGIVAGSSGMLLLSSVLVMSDAAGMFWAALSALLALRWDRCARQGIRRSPWLALSAAALALAVVTRWIYAGLVPPFALYAILAIRRRIEATGDVHGQRAFVAAMLPPLGLAAVIFLAIVTPQLWLSQLAGAPATGHEWVVNWNPLNALRRSFDTPDGHFDYAVPPLIFYAAPFFHPLYLSPLLTGCVLLGAWRLRRSLAAVLLGGWIGTLYFYLVGVPFQNLRFGLAFFVPVAILAGVGLSAIPLPPWLRSARASGPSDQRIPGANTHSTWRVGWLVLALSSLVTLGFTYRALSALRVATSAEHAAIDFLAARVSPESTVVSFELSIALEYYTRLTVVDLYAQSPDSLRARICTSRPVFLYVNPARLEAQWLGRSPDENFRYIRDRIGLAEIGGQAGWILYRLAPCRS